MFFVRTARCFYPVSLHMTPPFLFRDVSFVCFLFWFELFLIFCSVPFSLLIQPFSFSRRWTSEYYKCRKDSALMNRLVTDIVQITTHHDICHKLLRSTQCVLVRYSVIDNNNTRQKSKINNLLYRKNSLCTCHRLFSHRFHHCVCASTNPHTSTIWRNLAVKLDLTLYLYDALLRSDWAVACPH